MTWIANAATEIAAGIVLDAEITNSRDGIASIITTHAEPLVALLRESRREHYHAQHANEYEMRGCCPECSCGEAGTSGDCTCGADTWNARIDAMLEAK